MKLSFYGLQYAKNYMNFDNIFFLMFFNIYRYTDPKVEEFLLMSSSMDPRFKSLPYLDETRRLRLFEALQQKAVEMNAKMVNYNQRL
jgi:hypothetical protein